MGNYEFEHWDLFVKKLWIKTMKNHKEIYLYSEYKRFVPRVQKG